MCGLVGFISDCTTSPLSTPKIFRQMLFADSLRGEDSTGIFYANRKGKAGWYKEAVPGYDFVADKRISKLMDDRGLAFMVGHNRYATSGNSWDVEGAHPFRHGKIIMAHNGTLDNHWDLPNGRNFVVDSEAICHNLNRIGYDETIERLEGAFTLVWYNSDDNKLCMVRNSERPLFLAHTVNGIFFASEKPMLEWILDRNNVHVREIESLPVGELREYDITTVTLPCSKRRVKLAPLPAYKGWYGSYDRQKKGQAGTVLHNHINPPASPPSTPTTTSTPEASNKPIIINSKGDTYIPSIFELDDMPVPEAGYDVECCICSDSVPSTLAAKVQGSDEWVCKECDEGFFQASGQPMQGNEDWLPALER